MPVCTMRVTYKDSHFVIKTPLFKEIYDRAGKIGSILEAYKLPA